MAWCTRASVATVLTTHPCVSRCLRVNTLKLRPNDCHFPDYIFKCIFLNENIWISIKNSLKFVPKGPINNIPDLVQIMAWRGPGDKPLYEAIMFSSLMHIWVTRPQWVNSLWSSDAIWLHRSGSVWLHLAISWTDIELRFFASIPVHFHRKCARLDMQQILSFELKF